MNDRYRTDLFVQHLYKDQPGKLRFDPEKIRTKEEFDDWKEQVRVKAYVPMKNRKSAFFFPSRETATVWKNMRSARNPSSGYRFF